MTCLDRESVICKPLIRVSLLHVYYYKKKLFSASVLGSPFLVQRHSFSALNG